jgi:hypothetical protein
MPRRFSQTRGVCLSAVALAFGSAHGQVAYIGGDVVQSSSHSALIAVAAGAGASAQAASSSVVAGSQVGGSVAQTSAGGPMIAVAAGTDSQARVMESTVCGAVSRDARLTSYVKSAMVFNAVPGQSSSIEIASVGPGTRGAANSAVYAGNIRVVNGAPQGPSTISLGSYGGGC